MNTKKLLILTVISVILISNISIKTKHKADHDTLTATDKPLIAVDKVTLANTSDDEPIAIVVEEFSGVNEPDILQEEKSCGGCCLGTSPCDPYAPCDKKFNEEIRKEEWKQYITKKKGML